MTDRELMRRTWEFFSRYILVNEMTQESLDAEAKTILEALRARLAQPEQEPVAKMREMLEVQGRDGNWNYDAYMQGMYNGMEFMVALVEGRDPVFRDPPEKWLHTPPQREWQGLTKEDKREIIDETEPEDRGYVMALVEAKLKDKNGTG